VTPQILVVDDHVTNLKLARVLLESEGYLVETAEDAEAALSILGRAQPRLVLMDLQLPGMDGLELTRRLRADPRWDSTWIVALTAYAMKGDDQKALGAGCDVYLTKPLDIDAFSGVVARLLQRPRAGPKLDKDAAG
jgi:CheY-like chemotaxis protein